MTDSEASQGKSFEDLARAAEAEEQAKLTDQIEQSVEEPAEDVVPDEPDDNADRSKLGRKVRELSDQIAQSQADSTRQLAEAVESMKNMAQSFQQSQEPEVDDEEPLVLTGKEQDERIDARLDKRDQAKSQYDTDFGAELARVATAAGDTQAFFDIVAPEVYATGVVRTGNARADAEKAYLKAANKVLRQSAGQPVNPLKGEKPRAPLGGGPGQQNKNAAPKAKVKLDAAAQKFVDMRGKSDEFVQRVLGAEE